MSNKIAKLQIRLLTGAALLSLSFSGLGHAAESASKYSIPPQSLGDALRQFGYQSGRTILFDTALTNSKTTRGLWAESDAETALNSLLQGTGLSYRRDGDVFAIVTARNSMPLRHAAEPIIAAETVSGSAVEGLVVTAQKKREQIQDVPIAISAFSADALAAQKIEGGFDLLKAIPNVTFSKNNFSGYNFSIRGIGTKAISVTTDPGVAVSFNNVTLIRNRLFEQEYFDVERVEVLRGPQGTLYGRNATSGVINLISAKADVGEFDGSLKGEVGNYHSKRLVGMVNVPLIQDVLAVRFAGSQTQRDGYGINLYNDESTDGRDLWSARLSIGFEPTESVRADLIWERFDEDDNRSRTGKQLCTHDPGPDQIGNTVLAPRDEPWAQTNRGYFNQGCLPGSLYDDAAFGTPNGLAIPFVLFLEAVGGGFGAIRQDADPYGDQTQSRDLRALYSQIEAVYRAQADVFELNVDVDVTPSLTFSSQTAYNKDQIYSTQDFNRYTTLPVITDTSVAFPGGRFEAFAPNGVFCDPQLGCSDTVVGMDLSRAKSTQFSQEFRLQSAFDGPLNFSVGANYTRYRTVEDYYVFFNGITMTTIWANALVGFHPSKTTLHPDCAATQTIGPFEVADSFICVPIENNPISEIQDTGHNYFLSRNPYTLKSGGVFGEVYWQTTQTLKITGGLRYTDDRKTFTPIPSQVLLSDPARLDSLIPLYGQAAVDKLKAAPITSFASGAYPALPDVQKQWQEVTGRLGFDWKPELSFTDETMIYAFYSRGYKGGGLNPPRIGLNYEDADAQGFHYTPSAPPDFKPEFVNAYELGAKNTLLGGALVLNGNAFFYDYKDYQVSKIVDRTANNENYDAKVWGLEFESVLQATENLRFNASLGYLNTELAEGSKSIDIFNRTAGHDDWIIVKPAVSLTSNCIAPVSIVEKVIASSGTVYGNAPKVCPGGDLSGYNYTGEGPGGETLPDGSTYDPRDYPEANFGAGFDTDVSGNELPNSPHFTVSLGGEYSWDLLEGWNATVRGDFYWQSQQWARVYQLPIDKLHAWSNTNLRLTVEKPEEDLQFEFYIKNVFDETPITDTFLNSDDTALTTNIFVLDPRIIGVSLTKGF